MCDLLLTSFNEMKNMTKNIINTINTISYDDLCELPFNFVTLNIIETNLTDAKNAIEFHNDENTLYNVLINMTKLCLSHYSSMPANKTKTNAFLNCPIILIDVLLENFDDDDDVIIECADHFYIDNAVKSTPCYAIETLYNQMIKMIDTPNTNHFSYRFNCINDYVNTYSN
jgi:hypothetical protein